MIAYSMWKNIIKTTIIAYVIACAIPGGITGVFYLNSTYLDSYKGDTSKYFNLLSLLFIYKKT